MTKYHGASQPSTKIIKQNQSRQIPAKLLSIEKNLASYISTISQGFKAGSKRSTISPTYLFRHLIWHIQVKHRSTNLDVTTVFHVRPYGRFMEIKNILRKKKLHTMNQGSNILGGSLRQFILADVTDNIIKGRIYVQQKKCRIKNEALTNTSINRISLKRFKEKRPNKVQYLTSNSIRLEFGKKTSLPNTVESFGSIQMLQLKYCCPRLIKSRNNSIN